MKLTKLFNEFFLSGNSAGIVLIFCTILSMVLANSGAQEAYQAIWNTHLAGHSIVHWINDGLMVIFFLLIGLELEREVYIGELSNLKNSMLPILAAIGGMIVPASIYMLINAGAGGASGAGIPMATDIAFALGAPPLHPEPLFQYY